MIDDSLTTVKLVNESDVEQKFLYRLITSAAPYGLGYSDSEVLTKVNIKKLNVDKGKSKKLYYPDYVININGLPLLVIEAKAPGEDIEEAYKEARLYAGEINASYPSGVNPCAKIIVTNGDRVISGRYDSNDYLVDFFRSQITSASQVFSEFLDFSSRDALASDSKKILKKIKSKSEYFKPIYMLGGKSTKDESIGENSFGANVSVEYRYLFNPETTEERKAIVENAYVTSKRKESHISPIDKLIRSSVQPSNDSITKVLSTDSPREIVEVLKEPRRMYNQICLLVGSVGSGKSTFTDYMKVKGLPDDVAGSTGWVNINLNKAPLSRSVIYDWIIDGYIEQIENSHGYIDFKSLDVITELYQSEISDFKKGRASLFSPGSDKYNEILFDELERLQSDKALTLRKMIDYVYLKKLILPIVVLDNCDKRTRDDQLLMFEVATWLKNEFRCMVFLPIRDVTYDIYRSEPPLDTVIKDFVFRIDPPLLEKVIYSRLNYAIREVSSRNCGFKYRLNNGVFVECSKDEISQYLKAMVESLFQEPLFKRIVSGLAGKNMRKGLEIFLDFCKSGHVPEEDILKIRQSGGEHRLPIHVISKILFKGKRIYYSDSESNIKNLFHSDRDDDLPNPFARIAILRWLKMNYREYGPSKLKGYHRVSSLYEALSSAGQPIQSIEAELRMLVETGCVDTDSRDGQLSISELVCISPSGMVHLDLLKNINYLSSVSEDTYFRENQPAKIIANNIVGRGAFKENTFGASISNSKALVDYMVGYYNSAFSSMNSVVSTCPNLIKIDELQEFVDMKADNNGSYRELVSSERDHPPGSLVDGKVTVVRSFGFVVEFGLKGSGLIHVTRLGSFDKNIMKEIEEGSWVQAEVCRYVPNKRRYDLKLISIL
ncbi:MAG: type I restriction endonuclease [Pseudomonadota bacterium]|nr:type I restriction endonuclease [Pseudomonadota bacterium]